LSDQSTISATHSQFFKSLKDRGYTLTFNTADDATLALVEYGVYLYEHLIIFSPQIEQFGGSIEEAAIIDFIDSGRNVFIAAEPNAAEPTRHLANDAGIVIDARLVVDHIHHAENSEDDHGNLVVEVGQNLQSFLGADKFAPVLYRGASMTLNEKSVTEGLLFNLLTARSTSYPQPKATLVGALQARNNARVVVAGSVSMFSDKFFDGKVKGSKAGNEKFAAELTSWAFKERSVLRYSNVAHHRVGETVQPEVYRVVDNCTFSVDIEEWKGEKWVPYKADDVPLEWIMLDPYVRKFLKADNNGKFALTFTLPDVYGIFTFQVDYHRAGYTNLFVETRVQVRPFRHNEYERFIDSAYPYYAATFSMLVGIFCFSFVFLYHKDQKIKTN
jgi:oligosaccharyltransferase complex subunit beta